MIFAAIADWADSGDFSVTLMCDWLGVSRSGYYAWRTAEPSQRSKDVRMESKPPHPANGW